MKQSIYEKILLVVGFLIAFEIVIKLGLLKSLLPLICEFLIIALLIYFMHKASEAPKPNPTNYTQKYQPENYSEKSINDSNWQRQHDQWWQNHHQTKQSPIVNKVSDASKKEVNQLEINKQYLKQQTNLIDQKIKHLKAKGH